jgi:hypothetical protein
MNQASVPCPGSEDTVVLAQAVSRRRGAQTWPPQSEAIRRALSARLDSAASRGRIDSRGFALSREGVRLCDIARLDALAGTW